MGLLSIGVNMKSLFAKVRPQIMAAIIVLGAIGLYSLRLGVTEAVTSAITAIGVLSMKVLEDKD